MAEMVTRIDWGSMRGEVDRFEQYLREVKQASENTVQSYRRDLMQMITYLEEKEIREAAKVTKTSCMDIFFIWKSRERRLPPFHG